MKKPDRRAFSRVRGALARSRNRIPGRQATSGAADPLDYWAEQKGLTAGERRVVHQSVRGLSNKEIAAVLGLSAATVRTHLLATFRKLGIASRGELAHAVFTVIETRSAELSEERRRLILELEAQRAGVERERALLDTVIQQSPLGLIVMEKSGAVVLANDVAVRVLGGRPRDLAHHHELLRARHPDGRFYSFQELPTVRALAGETVRVEIRREAPDGSETTLEVHSAPIMDRSRNVTGALGILVDVTHHKATVAELARAEKAAIEALRTREEFMKAVSSDLHAPARSLARFGETLTDVLGQDESTRRAAIIARHVSSTAMTMARFLRDLVDLSELDAGACIIRPRVLDPVWILRECVRSQTKRARSASVTLETRVKSGLPTVLADPDRLHRVLETILDRAIDVSPGSGTVVVEAEPMLANVQLTIRDEGPALPHDHETKIFDRTWLATVGARRGFGLGFLVAREVVERHFGRLWAESGPRGTAFRLLLPAR